MPNRSNSSLLRATTVLAFLLVLAGVLAGCTPGGQFDPTTILDNDMFDTKTKLKGQRVPLFPDGVPGTTTGVPADLVKGYQPPSDQANADPDATNAPPPDQAQQGPNQAQQEAKPEPKPKPKVAVARPRTPIQKPPSSTPTRIDIGAKGAPAQPASQANWPASPQSGAPPQQGFVWPAPPPTAPHQQAAQQSQSVWPAPPSTAPAQPQPAAAPPSAPASQTGSQTGRSFDSMWPNPPPSGTISQ